jgi:Cu(I)-responsive transcriptional regulator
VPSHLTIGRLASATGVNVETIRYYERSGLIAPPARTEGNYRSYRDDDVSRLRFIRRTRDLGFSLDQVRALLSIAGERDRDCGTVDAIAADHLAEVDRKIADLTALRRELADAVASCAGGTVAECRILEAFSPARERPRALPTRPRLDT